jgi:hypothetical protein
MASIGRYLHQWPRFRRHHAKPPRPKERPSLPTAVHQRWQVDFKLGIALRDQTLVNLHTVHDPVGEVCIGATLFPAGHVGGHPRQVTLPQVQATLRACFTRWHTLPDEVQTDGDPVLRGREDFPSRLTLWLQGLGIQHLVIRPGRPTDNAEVERCHRTVHDYALVGNERYALAPLQELLNQAVQEMASTLPSRAEGCAGQPPLLAHPDLLQPRRPYQPDRELLLFDLRRADAYLATYTWERKVGRTGQITLGGRHTAYSVGRASAGQHIRIRFDPSDRSFVFFDAKLEHEIGRRPARGLGVADLTGIISLPSGPVPQQLPLPEPFWRGVSC